MFFAKILLVTFEPSPNPARSESNGLPVTCHYWHRGEGKWCSCNHI